MQTLVKQLADLVSACSTKSAELDRRLSEVAQREEFVQRETNRVAGLDDAQTILRRAREQTRVNEQERAKLEEDRIAFSNLMKEERQAVANERGRLAPLQDRERELFQSQQNLYAREAALEIEKKEFKTRYIEKIKAHFAQTNGKAPNPDEIT